MSVSLKKGSTMIVIILTLLACFLMGCSISHLPDHPDFPVPAPLATDITTISEHLDTTATFTSFNEQLVFWSANHEHLPNITVIDY